VDNKEALKLAIDIIEVHSALCGKDEESQEVLKVLKESELIPKDENKKTKSRLTKYNDPEERWFP